MRKLLIVSVLASLSLISCGKSEEVKTVVNPPVVEKQATVTPAIVESNTGKIEEVTTGVISGSGVEPAKDICTTEKEVKDLKEKVVTMNKQNKNGLFQERGVNINFGKYGYTTFSGSENKGFGPYKIDGGPCVEYISQMYVFEKVQHRIKDDIMKQINKYKYENGEGTKFKEILKINGLDVVVWEDFGGYPTDTQYFEVIGKYENYKFTTHGLYFDNKSADYDFIVSVIKSLKIGNTESKISFSDEQIKDILAKIDENTRKQHEQVKNVTGVLVQGDTKVEYIAPKDYSKDTDKIIVTHSGKISEFRGLYVLSNNIHSQI